MINIESITNEELQDVIKSFINDGLNVLDMDRVKYDDPKKQFLFTQMILACSLYNDDYELNDNNPTEKFHKRIIIALLKVSNKI